MVEIINAIGRCVMAREEHNPYLDCEVKIVEAAMSMAS
jgi:hypothetical protein